MTFLNVNVLGRAVECTISDEDEDELGSVSLVFNDEFYIHFIEQACTHVFQIVHILANGPTQVDQNGIVYDPKTDRKCL